MCLRVGWWAGRCGRQRSRTPGTGGWRAGHRTPGYHHPPPEYHSPEHDEKGLIWQVKIPAANQYSYSKTTGGDSDPEKSFWKPFFHIFFLHLMRWTPEKSKVKQKGNFAEHFSKYFKNWKEFHLRKYIATLLFSEKHTYWEYLYTFMDTS